MEIVIHHIVTYTARLFNLGIFVNDIMPFGRPITNEKSD